MSEKEIINFFTHTGACHYLKYDSIRKIYYISFKELENYTLLQGYYLDVRTS